MVPILNCHKIFHVWWWFQSHATYHGAFFIWRCVWSRSRCWCIWTSWCTQDQTIWWEKRFHEIKFEVFPHNHMHAITLIIAGVSYLRTKLSTPTTYNCELVQRHNSIWFVIRFMKVTCLPLQMQPFLLHIWPLSGVTQSIIDTTFSDHATWVDMQCSWATMSLVLLGSSALCALWPCLIVVNESVK